MINKFKAISLGLVGAIIGALLVGLCYTAYQDHVMLWRVVGVLSQPAPAAAEKK